MTESVLTRAGAGLCLGGAALGALGLLGWITGTPRLATVVSGLPPMMPNTALALLLIGGAGAMRPGANSGTARSTLSLLATLVVLVIGAGTLIEYGLGIDLRIDHVLALSPSTSPARPSVPTALSLTFLATALLVLDVGPTARIRPSEFLVLCGALTAFTGLTGIIFGAPVLYRSSETPLIGTSLPTALSLLLISMGVLLRSQAGIMDVAFSPGPGGILLRRLALPAIVIPVALGLVITQIAFTQGIEGTSIPIAVLAVAMAVLSLFLLGVTAPLLNRAHENVQASRAHTASLVDQAPDGIFVADLDGRYTDVNEAGCRMLGYTREEIVGKTIIDLIPPGDIERLWQAKTALLQGGIQVAEWSLRRKDGNYVPVEVSAKILPDGRWQGFVRDISERKRLENEQRLLAEAAQRAIKARDEVLGIVAHDLRNPLAMILIEARLLRRHAPERERRSQDSADAIQGAVTRMDRLIQDLLDATRIEAGGLTIEPRLVNVTEAASDAVRAQAPLTSSQSLELRLDLERDLPDVWADRDRLRQVFENVIGNAIKFTPSRGTITVGAARQGTDVLFWVSDTGPGIDIGDQPHVFDRFWQGRAKNRGGAGLGLPIVKGIVEAHGGRVWVESALAQGTTVRFTIPTAQRVG